MRFERGRRDGGTCRPPCGATGLCDSHHMSSAASFAAITGGVSNNIGAGVGGGFTNVLP